MTGVVEHVYRPRGAAKRLLECREPELLLSGPAGTGKSRACLQKLHYMALLNPGMRGLMVRKTAVSLTSTGLVTFREHVAKEAIATGHLKWYGGSQQEAACYRYANGSILNVGGLDRATKIMSSEYDVVFAQEAIELTVNDWEAITTRLRNGRVSFQQLIADTNPDTPTHWLKARADRGDTLLMESRHEDNPVLFNDDGTKTQVGQAYISKLDKLTGVRYQRLRKGLWVAAEGQIYEDWDPHAHLIPRFNIPDAWTRWWTVDFGFNHPFVCQWWAEDPDGTLYLYRQLQRTQRLVEDHAKTMLAQVRHDDGTWKEPKPRAVICDHDAEGRATLEKYLGMSTSAANKKIKPSEGIQMVASRLKAGANGRRRLYVLQNSLIERDPELEDAKQPTCVEEEIPGYVWDANKEQPIKENDDGCDAMRYMVVERDAGGRPRLRWVG